MFKTSTGKAIRPEWIPADPGQPYWTGYWTIAREHLSDVARAVAIRDGSVTIEMHYSTTEQCDSRCQGATGVDCTCACEGEHHGNGEHAAWIPVGDTTLIRGAGSKIVVRSLTRAQAEAEREAEPEETIRQVTGRG